MKKQNQNVDIIDVILKNAALEAAPKEGEIRIINAENFFSNEDGQCFCSKEGFLKLIKSCDKNDLKAIDHTFNLMNEKTKFDVSPFERIDNKGRSYVWIGMDKKNTTGGYKLPTCEDLCLLINLYGFDLIKCDLTLESLYHKAMS